MREALRIFAKDSRQLMWSIALLLACLVMFAYSVIELQRLLVSPSPAEWSTGFSVAFLGFAPALIGVVGSYLVAQVVLNDSLHGDRQFWVTRPYHRSSLFISKLWFVIACISAPLALVQLAVVAADGGPVMSVLPRLAVSHLFAIALLAAPLLALSALSPSLPWFIASLVPVAAVLAAIVGDAGRLGDFDWVRLSAVALLSHVTAAAVLWVQYRHRRTWLARVIVVAGMVGALFVSRGIGFDTAFAVQHWVHGERVDGVSASLIRPAAEESLVEGPSERTRAVFEAAPGGILLPMWFAVDGVSDDTVLACDASRVVLTAQSGRVWADSIRFQRRGPTRASDGCPGFVQIPRSAPEFLEGPVTVDAELYVTIFEAKRTTEVPLGTRRYVPGLGPCVARPWSYTTAVGESVRGAQVRCASPFRTPAVAVSFDEALVFAARPSYSPWPADLRLQPLTHIGRLVRTEATAVPVVTRAVQAHTRLRAHEELVDLNRYAGQFGG